MPASKVDLPFPLGPNKMFRRSSNGPTSTGLGKHLKPSTRIRRRIIVEPPASAHTVLAAPAPRSDGASHPRQRLQFHAASRLPPVRIRVVGSRPSPHRSEPAREQRHQRDRVRTVPTRSARSARLPPCPP